ERHEAAIKQAEARVKQMQARKDTAEAERVASAKAVKKAESFAKSAAAYRKFRKLAYDRIEGLAKQDSIAERLVDEKFASYQAAFEAEVAANVAIDTAKAQEKAAEAKIEETKADIEEANAQVKVAEAERDKAKVMLDFATIRAPFNGKITQRGLFPRSFVRAATLSGTSVPLFTVERTDKFRVVVQVPDRDVPFVDEGDPAFVEMDAIPGGLFKAKVSRKSDSEDPQTRLMHVEIDVENNCGKIRAGMFGRVTIILEK